MTNLRNLCVRGATCSFTVCGDTNFANAIRRALLSDIKTNAPSHVVIKKNTTCMPDEYIAHRIGLVPFGRLPGEKKVEDTVAHVSVTGRDVTCADITSTDFAASRDGTIVTMTSDQSFEADIFFETSTAAKHSKFLPIGPVSYKQVAQDKLEMSFESMTRESPLLYLRAALTALHARLEDTRCYVERHRAGL